MPGDGVSSGVQLLGMGRKRVGQSLPLELQPWPQNLSYRTTLSPTVVEVAHIGVVEIGHGLGHGAGGTRPRASATRPPAAAAAGRRPHPRRACCASTQPTTAERETSAPPPKATLRPRPLRSSAPPFAVLVWIPRLENSEPGRGPVASFVEYKSRFSRGEGHILGKASHSVQLLASNGSWGRGSSVGTSEDPAILPFSGAESQIFPK